MSVLISCTQGTPAAKAALSKACSSCAGYGTCSHKGVVRKHGLLVQSPPIYNMGGRNSITHKKIRKKTSAIKALTKVG